jgi:hypothetical protein
MHAGQVLDDTHGMTESDLVVQCLEAIPDRRCCDDCLVKKTRIRPRSQLSRLCRELAEKGELTRKRGKCPLGDHTKMLNTLAAQPARAARRTVKSAPADTLGIEDAWRYIDRFCRAIWVKHLGNDTPSSLAEAITALRDEELVPPHEANMMHTIRSLRNMVVHEDVNFGEHENAIARAAWEIIRAWAERRERNLWNATSTMCGRRAA